MEQVKFQSRLFTYMNVEARDEQEEKYERAYATVQSIIASASEKEANDKLSAAVSKGSQIHEEISIGLLVGILSEPQNSARYYRDLTYITRDGMTLVVNHFNQIVLEKYTKLQDTARNQMIWLTRELIKNNVPGIADGLCTSILRQIIGGDITSRNVWLAENMLDTFIDHKLWLEKSAFLVAFVAYTYLRIIVDHSSQMLATFRQREIEFTVHLLRDRFSECMIIGRDLVRLLQNVARITEFEKFWKDMILNPSSICPGFAGIQQLMTQRTSRRFLQSRLTPDMERKIVFLTSQVKFGSHKRYQDWFQKQYLSTPESQTLRCDLIRFIVGVIHPTNELLCSDIIPRWAVIGWLLTTCTSNVAASNAKLSLFYDWLFYDPEKDNIMNIEPAILVMYHSIRPHPAITATLLDFLCRIIPNFHPFLADKVKQGVYTSLRQILEKRVLPSLSPLFDNPKLDRELLTVIRDIFSEFCSTGDGGKLDEALAGREPSDSILENNHSGGSNDVNEAEFSDDEDDIPLAKVRLRDRKSQPTKEASKLEQIDLSEYLDQMGENLKISILELQSEKDKEAQCEVVEKLVQAIIQDEDFEQDSSTALASSLCALFNGQFNEKIFPLAIDDESVEDSIGSPLFVMFRNLCQTAEEDPSRQPLLLLLTEMYHRQPKIGYYLLYFIKASKLNDDKMSAYRDLCKYMESKDLQRCLVTDMRLCQEDDVRLFCYLVPDIYNQFPNIAIGSSDLLGLIVSCIDATQLQDLVCHILQGAMIMFRKDSFIAILNASLEWETFEQYCLWQLITAHNIPVDYVLPILPRLEFTAHAEALTSILLLLKQEKPTAELLKHIMTRAVKHHDMFVVSVLKYWSQEHEDKLAELVSSQLIKFNSSPNKRKRQPNKSQGITVTVDQTLSHLDQLRQYCKQTSFFNRDSIQQAILQVQNSCTDSQKNKFSDLFALAEDLDDIKPSHTKSRGGKKGTTNSSKSPASNKNKTVIVINSDTSDTSSEEEEIIRPSQAKKRKKISNVGSDSD